MARKFIILRRKNSKRFMGAVPIRKGASIARIKKNLSPAIKKGFAIRIVSDKQLKAIIVKQRPRKKRGKR